MNANLKSFKIRKTESGNIDLRIQSDKMVYPTSFIASKEEIPLIIDNLNGNTDVYPFYSDISYLMQFSEWNVKYIHLSSSYDGKGKYEEYSIYFPFHMLDELFAFLSDDNSDNNLFELSQDRITELSELVKPVIAWHYTNFTDGKWTDGIWNEWIVKDLKERVDHWSSLYPDCKDLIERLENIAKNYSNGNTVTIYLSFDCWNRNDDIPDSFYFDIRNDKNQRIMNGGIIAHKDDRTNTYHYSMHT